jgi:hypothetical protein
MFFKKENLSASSVLVLEFGAVTFASYGTDEDGDDITTIGTDRGFVALLGLYSLPVGAKVALVTKGEFLDSSNDELTLEDAEVWAEISFGEAALEVDVISDHQLLEALFITNGKIEQRES